MKKSWKGWLATAAVVVAIGVVIIAGLNYWLTLLVRRQLDNNVAAAGNLFISYEDVHLTVSGRAKITNVHFRTDSLAFEDSIRQVVDVQADAVSLEGINYYDWLVRRQVQLRGLNIVRPVVHTRFVHDPSLQHGLDLEARMTEERRRRLERVLHVARIFIDEAVVKRITVSDASIDAAAINDSLRVCVSDFSMNIYDIGYSIKDSVPRYNDSVFHFLLQDVEVRIPEAAALLTVRQLQAEPSGVMDIYDVRAMAYLDDSYRQSVDAGVEHVRVGGFDAAQFNAYKQMQIRNVHLYNPEVALRIDETMAATPIAGQVRLADIDSLDRALLQAKLDVAAEFITGLTIDTIAVHQAAVDVRSLSSAFWLRSDSLDLSVFGLGYSLIDEIPYHYNDSVYHFFLGHSDIITPDSLLRVTASDVRYDNGGAFEVGPTHIRHIVDRWQLAHRMGDMPSSWIDMHLNSLRTSSKNVVREVLTVRDGFRLDTLYADVASMHVFRDKRFSPKQPYTLPQTNLLNLTYPFVVRRVDARLRKVQVEMALTEKSVGRLALNDLHVSVRNVTPIPNSVIRVAATGKIGTGSLRARFDMTVNRACDWHIALDAKNLNTHCLDDMIYPIVGMKIGCDVHHLTADYGGNKDVANGTFCMEYDHLDIHAYKDSDSPFTVVGKMSGLINSAGKTLVNQSNPSRPGKEPLSYQVTWKNDIWTDPAIFYIGPVINGCVETLLPGLFIHRRTSSAD